MKNSKMTVLYLKNVSIRSMTFSPLVSAYSSENEISILFSKNY